MDDGPTPEQDNITRRKRATRGFAPTAHPTIFVGAMPCIARLIMTIDTKDIELRNYLETLNDNYRLRLRKVMI